MNELQGTGRVDFYGTIETGDRKVVADVLRRWLDAAGRTGQLKSSRNELRYDDHVTRVHCRKADTGWEEAPYFLLEGHLTVTLDGATVQLGALVLLCQSAGLAWDVDYVQVDDNGFEVGEELTILAETARTMSTRERNPSLPRMFET
jgi:hypothetical protein